VKAQDTTGNNYSIFKPLPRASLREDMASDRPDITETPHTVDPGHFQYEADLVNYETEKNGSEKIQHLLVNQMNLKLGLFKNTDLQIGIQSYGKDITKKHGVQKETASGFGDITVRIKQCLYGNYQGYFSIGLIPFVKIPTNNYNGNNSVEGGLIVPLQFDLANDWGLETQVKGDYLKNEASPGYHTEFMQSLSVSHPLFKIFDVVGETYYSYNFKDHSVENFIDAVIVYSLNNNVKFDTGLYYGLQKEATKTCFLGIAFRY
ncbi:MAG: transporter, partial [Sphingobacteriaceae bacterium]